MEISNYITLPCKVTNDSDPVNKIENFTVPLADEFNLQDDWEIGLCEISLPKTWHYIPIDQYLDILYFDKSQLNYFAIHSEKSKVEKGSYKTNKELISVCNEAIDKLFEKINDDLYVKGMTEHKVVTRKPHLKFYDDDYTVYYYPGIFDDKELFYIRFDSFLGNVLGLEKHALTNRAYNEFTKYNQLLRTQSILPDIKSGGQWFPSWKHINLGRNIKHLFVTSDVISNSYYRNIRSDILRIVDVPDNVKFGDQISHIYNNVYYFPLKKNQFDKINVKIYIDDTNDNTLVPFQFGEIYLVLHLRKVSKEVKIELENVPNETPEGETKTDEPAIGNPFDKQVE